MKTLIRAACIVLSIVLIAAAAPLNNQSEPSIPRLLVHDAAGKTFVPQPGGEFDPFPFVASLYTEKGELMGSGVLVTSNLLLTAAHVVRTQPFVSKISFDGGLSFIWIKKVRCPDIYDQGVRRKLGPNQILGDIAVVLLDQEVEIPAIQMNPAPLRPYRGESIIVIGFGHGMKAYTLPGTILYGTLEGDDSLIWLAAPAFAMGGDSGGAVLLRTRTGQVLLVGIVKSRMTINSMIVDSRATRIDKHFFWLQETMRELTADQ